MADEFTDGGSGEGYYVVRFLGAVNITKFGLQTGTDRTVYVTWSWGGDHTKEYHVIWYYYTGNGVAFVGDDSTTTSKQSSYPDSQSHHEWNQFYLWSRLKYRLI